MNQVCTTLSLENLTTFIEIYRHKITADDKFMIIASDGLWEFISSEDAIEVVVPFWHIDNPTMASEELTKLAVQKWTKHDSSIDDITVVVVFLSRSTINSNYRSV